MSPEGLNNTSPHKEPEWNEVQNDPVLKGVKERIEQRTQEEIAAAKEKEDNGSYENEPAYIQNRIGEEEWHKFVEEDPERAEKYRNKVWEVGLFAESREKRLQEETVLHLDDLKKEPEIVGATSMPREKVTESALETDNTETREEVLERLRNPEKKEGHEDQEHADKDSHATNENHHSGSHGGGHGHGAKAPWEVKLVGLGLGTAAVMALANPKWFFTMGFYDYLGFQLFKHLKDDWRSLVQDFWPFGKLDLGKGGGGKKKESGGHAAPAGGGDHGGGH